MAARKERREPRRGGTLKLARGLSIGEVLRRTVKGEHWLYCPATGVLTFCAPLDEEERKSSVRRRRRS